MKYELWSLTITSTVTNWRITDVLIISLRNNSHQRPMPCGEERPWFTQISRATQILKCYKKSESLSSEVFRNLDLELEGKFLNFWNLNNEVTELKFANVYKHFGTFLNWIERADAQPIISSKLNLRPPIYILPQSCESVRKFSSSISLHGLASLAPGTGPASRIRVPSPAKVPCSDGYSLADQKWNIGMLRNRPDVRNAKYREAEARILIMLPFFLNIEKYLRLEDGEDLLRSFKILPILQTDYKKRRKLGAKSCQYFY